MQAIAHVIPIAIAVAVSSVPIMTAIFILLSPDRSRAAIPFMIGWIVGIALVVSACTLLSHAVPTPRSDRKPDTVLGVLEILVGLALIALSIIDFRRARGRVDVPVPKKPKKARSLGPWSALGFGLVLNVRPKGLLLAIAAGLSVRADATSVPDGAVAIVVYTLIGASTVAIPIIATTAAPSRMEPRLVRSHDWISANGKLLTRSILLVIGIVVVAMGIERL